MRVIICNMQMFSNDQMIQIVDTENGQIAHLKVDIENLPTAICALAKEHGIANVKLSGGKFAETWANEIRETNELNYGSKNIEVEVI